MQLQDIAQVVRSKNAGPRRFTLDIIFRNDGDYQRAVQSKALTAARLASLYGVAAEAISVINCPLSRATNVVVPWPVHVCDAGDRNVYTARNNTHRCWRVRLVDMSASTRILGRFAKSGRSDSGWAIR